MTKPKLDFKFQQEYLFSLTLFNGLLMKYIVIEIKQYQESELICFSQINNKVFFCKLETITLGWNGVGVVLKYFKNKS